MTMMMAVDAPSRSTLRQTDLAALDPRCLSLIRYAVFGRAGAQRAQI